MSKKLKIGTKVFIKNEGIKPKLSSKYKGPFTIDKVDEFNNYILKDATGELVNEKFPLSKIKVVEREEIPESYEIEKILDHKKVSGKFKFLVKWKGYNHEDNTWESEDNFDSKQIINKYFKSLEKNKQSTKPSSTKTTANKPTTAPIRRSARIRNANQAILILCCLIPFIIKIASGSAIIRHNLIEFDNNLPKEDSYLVQCMSVR